jgi:hypothetical protein
MGQLIDLDVQLLQNGTNKEREDYVNELCKTNKDMDVCCSLFDLVEKGHVSPTIFDGFWPVDPHAHAWCIRSGPTCTTRGRGINAFSDNLKDVEKWKAAWEAMGGASGIVDACNELSVTEVKDLLSGIGRCNIGQQKIAERAKAIEKLLFALLPSYYQPAPRSSNQNGVQRPLENYYAQMVPACSPEFVEQLLDARDATNPLYKRLPVRRLIRTHVDTLRRHAIEVIFGDKESDYLLLRYFNAYLYTEPTLPSEDPKISASMEFAMKVFELRLKDIENRKWPWNVSEADLFQSLLRRSFRRKLPLEKVHHVFRLGLELIQVKPDVKGRLESRGFFTKLVGRWKEKPALYDDNLSLALRLGLGGSKDAICANYLQNCRI